MCVCVCVGKLERWWCWRSEWGGGKELEASVVGLRRWISGDADVFDAAAATTTTALEKNRRVSAARSDRRVVNNASLPLLCSRGERSATSSLCSCVRFVS